MKSIHFNNLQGKLSFNHPLARYTSWRVGGVAECFYCPKDLPDLQSFLSQIPASADIHWIGLGSNTLIRDGGLKGIVILTLGHLNQIDQIDSYKIRAEAGVPCAKLARLCARLGFEAGAFFAGIPGTIGGALAMNAGAFGSETWNHVVLVETLDRVGKLHCRPSKEFSFSYRHVDGLHGQYFVSAIFQFLPGEVRVVKEDIRKLLKKRNVTQPIGELSCGSVFRNPSNDFSARLIETAGLKGARIGGAFVSEKHANFIINDKRATAADIEELIELVADRVEKVHGVRLIPEVRIVGERK